MDTQSQLKEASIALVAVLELGRPPKKKTKTLAYALASGILKAEQDSKKKTPLKAKIIQYLETLLDKVDPLEAAAIIGGTIIVHEVIFQLNEFVDAVSAIPTNLANALGQSFYSFLDFIEQRKDPRKIPQGEGEKARAADADMYGIIISWLLAFAISYWTFKHGDELLTTAKSFFGMLTTSTPVSAAPA